MITDIEINNIHNYLDLKIKLELNCKLIKNEKERVFSLFRRCVIFCYDFYLLSQKICITYNRKLVI